MQSPAHAKPFKLGSAQFAQLGSEQMFDSNCLIKGREEELDAVLGNR